MALVVMLLFGWFLLSLPVGIVVGRLLRGSRPTPASGHEVLATRPGVARALTRVAV